MRDQLSYPRRWALAGVLCVSLPSCMLAEALGDEGKLRSALTFHASFDEGVDADFAKGDPKLYTWTDRKADESEAGLHTAGKSGTVASSGKFGGAIEFKHADAPWIYFHAKGNLAYQKHGWGGSVSLWLKCDPLAGLADGYCDPVQLTPRAWNDAAFFLDFNKEGSPRDFRLGAFADKKIWNPSGAEVAEDKRPLLTAKSPGFGAEKWTHVVFTWEGFNTGKKSAEAKLYIDGSLNGTLTGWDQRFTWTEGETPKLLLGLFYVGLLDEFSCFDRSLTAAEVKALHAMPGGVKALLGKG